MPQTQLILDGQTLTCEALAEVANGTAEVALDESGVARMQAARALVDQAIERGDAVYGLTTGLGARASEVLSGDELAAFSLQTVRGRAHAVGTPLPDAHVRAAMTARLNTLLRGAAAANPAVAGHLAACLNAHITPLVGEVGSIGAGDLVWNATLALALIGEGPVRDGGGRIRPGEQAMRAAGIDRLVLGPKDGLVLANHSGFSGALAALGVAEVACAIEAAQTAAALAMEGFRANLSPFDPRLLAVRPQAGQAEAAAGIMSRLSGGTLVSRQAARRLQDPLSIRNVAQVHGAALAALAFAREAAESEINGASDNPVALIEDGVIVSGGVYHTPHLSNALETASRAMAHLAMTQIARLSKLLSARFTGLPVFLAPESADSNGFAPVLKTAEALAGELVHAAAPVPVWPSINADGVEDALTSAPLAAKALLTIADRARRLCAIELMIAAQAVELRELGDEIAPAMRRTLASVREVSEPLDRDRPLGGEIDTLAGLIGDGVFGLQSR